MKHFAFTRLLSVLTGLVFLQGCGTALWPVATEGTVLYTQGARQHTAMLQIDLPPDRVYQVLLDGLKTRPHLKLINQDPKSYLIEVERDDGASLSGQATLLSDGNTLLFLWADAGSSGSTGKDLARLAAEGICKELSVTCTVRNN
ncbi:MAG: hypothetical protein PVG50_06295 [Thiohalophilus sp.]|jgi:hypothetical protein